MNNEIPADATPRFGAQNSARLKFDFHMHTLDDPFDHHVHHTVFELLDLAAQLHYDALAITLHTQQFFSRNAEKYAQDLGILLIPGVEQNIEGRHVLLINFPKEAAEGIRTFSDLARVKAQLIQADAPETLVIAAHPFFPSKVALQEKFWEHHNLFDAIEMSGFYHTQWNPNLKAQSAGKRLNLPLVGNSDTHTLEQFGKTWSEIECEKNAASIIRAIKDGKTEIKGNPLSTTEICVIGYKVIFRSYIRSINYKRSRGWQPEP